MELDDLPENDGDEGVFDLDALDAALTGRYDTVPHVSSIAEFAELAGTGALGTAFGSVTLAPEVTKRMFPDFPLSSSIGEWVRNVGSTISAESVRPALSEMDLAGLAGIHPKTLGFASMARSIADVHGGGSLSEQISRLATSQSEIEEMFESPALEPYRHSMEALDAALELATAAPAPEAPARVDESGETSFDRIEGALVQLVRIGGLQATHLDRLVVQADDGAKSGQRQFRYGIAVGALGVLLGVVTLWFTWQMWLSAK